MCSALFTSLFLSLSLYKCSDCVRYRLTSTVKRTYNAVKPVPILILSRKDSTTSISSTLNSEEEVSLARLAHRLHCPADCAELVLDVKLLSTSRDTITPLLPPDLVDSESENEDLGSQTPSPDVHSNDDQENETVNIKIDDKSNDMKIGRWTYSKGATRKPVKSRLTARLEDGDDLGTTSGRESERLLLYKESQRLLRETPIHLQEHRPKQFKRFSEFRQSLHDNIVPVLGEPENIRAP
ncbi:hypothetical protein AHF37_00966 [Paragonimus kellicotti]|nr:hypothetical protein AHF37_00966 [Paragonimus kellicotti]